MFEFMMQVTETHDDKRYNPKNQALVYPSNSSVPIDFCQIVSVKQKNLTNLTKDYVAKAVTSLIYTSCDIAECVDTNLKEVLSIRLPQVYKGDTLIGSQISFCLW